MQAIILAGGKGTRLRPLTLEMPKPVVPLVNRPFLSYQLDLLARVDLAEVTLSLSYRPDRIKQVMDPLTADFRVNYAVEDEPLGTGGAVRYAHRPGSGTVVVFNGDILNDLDLGAVLEFHRSRRAGVTIVLTEVEDPTNYGLVETDADGRVRQFLEKPSWEEVDGRTINAGTYVIEPEYLEMIREGEHVSIEREFFPALVQREVPFYAYVHRGYWIDIGTVGKYLRAHDDCLRRRVLEKGTPAGRPSASEVAGASIDSSTAVALGEGTMVAPGASFSRFCAVGRGCTIGEGAHLEGCVLWDNVTVEEGARLKGCVLGSGSRVGHHARINGIFVLGSNGHLPPYSRSDDDGGLFEAE